VKQNQSSGFNQTVMQVIRGLGLTAILLIEAMGTGAIAQETPSTNQPTSPPVTQTQMPQLVHLLFVNPFLGDDNGDGSQRSPFQTITHALQVAQPNTVLLLSAGTYSTETGETFPLVLKPGITLQGNLGTRGRGIVIRGGGIFLSPTRASQNITILSEDRAVLSGVTIINPNPGSYEVWIESGSPTITSNTLSGNTDNAIAINSNSTPVLQNNDFIGEAGFTTIATTSQRQAPNSSVTPPVTASAASIPSSNAPFTSNLRVSAPAAATLETFASPALPTFSPQPSSSEQPTSDAASQAIRTQATSPQAAIEIPVQRPNSRQRPTPTHSSRSPDTRRTTTAAAVPSLDLLPVPDSDIPVGNIGDLPTVNISRDPLGRNITTPSYSFNPTVLQGVRYRVLVEATSDRLQEEVRSLVPGAFRTIVNGQTMMQAGAYSDHANA
jgi:parallel beta-helix repeat protein